MPQRLAIIALVIGVASGQALADPPAEADKPAKKTKKPADLRVKPSQAQRIDLFPSRVLQRRATNERERRMTLGDDGDWKVQAAQVGAMVGVFGALLGLCGGGKCLVPGNVTDVLPDWMQAEGPVYTNPRRSQPVRSAR